MSPPKLDAESLSLVGANLLPDAPLDSDARQKIPAASAANVFELDEEAVFGFGHLEAGPKMEHPPSAPAAE